MKYYKWLDKQKLGNWIIEEKYNQMWDNFESEFGLPSLIVFFIFISYSWYKFIKGEMK